MAISLQDFGLTMILVSANDKWLCILTAKTLNNCLGVGRNYFLAQTISPAERQIHLHPYHSIDVDK